MTLIAFLRHAVPAPTPAPAPTGAVTGEAAPEAGSFAALLLGACADGAAATPPAALSGAAAWALGVTVAGSPPTVATAASPTTVTEAADPSARAEQAAAAPAVGGPAAPAGTTGEPTPSVDVPQGEGAVSLASGERIAASPSRARAATDGPLPTASAVAAKPADGVGTAETDAAEAADVPPAPTAGGEASPVAARRPQTPTAPGMRSWQDSSAPAGEPGPVSATGAGAAPQVAAPTRPAPSPLAERVAEIAQRLEQAPPPRRMTVEIGELRLTVSLRGDGVHVAVTGTAPADGPDWDRDLATALSARGFSLATDAGASGERREPSHPDRPAPEPAASRRRPASRTAPAGLRL